MAKTEGKHPGGRPTKYKPEYCLTVEYMARSGMTDAQMADFSTHGRHRHRKQWPQV